MGLIRTGNPAAEPVTLAEAKAHLRVDSSDEDALIAAMISAAREAAEHETGRTFVSTPWRLTLDQFPTSIALPMPRVTAVTQIHYVDGDGITQALNPAGYQLIADSEYEAWIEPAYGYSWPAVRAQAEAVRVTYIAGWSNAAAVPQAIKQWMLLAIGDMYASREATVIGTIAERLSFVDRLLDPYRVWSA